LNSFYIDFRFHGYSKRYLNSLKREMSRKFRVKGEHGIPHMTLYGPFRTTDSRGVFSRIERVVARYTLVPFCIDGFDLKSGRGGEVVAGRINASPELINLRRELAEELNKIVRIDDRQPWDNEDNFWFHTTIVMDVNHRKYEGIWHYINRKPKPHINQHLVRITILNRRGRIEREYDLVLKRWLNRRQALSKGLFRKTIDALGELHGEVPEERFSITNWLRKIFK